ncbi:nucleotidyl transferase AbiEii/AbiGii toxin family protein [Streptomyces sp. NPDC002172]
MATSADGEQCRVGVLKENLWARPVLTPYGPVLGLDDVIGTKVRALADRAAPRDFVDVRAAVRDHTITDLEMLGQQGLLRLVWCCHLEPPRGPVLMRPPGRNHPTRDRVRSEPSS